MKYSYVKAQIIVNYNKRLTETLSTMTLIAAYVLNWVE